MMKKTAVTTIVALITALSVLAGCRNNAKTEGSSAENTVASTVQEPEANPDLTGDLVTPPEAAQGETSEPVAAVESEDNSDNSVETQDYSEPEQDDNESEEDYSEPEQDDNDSEEDDFEPEQDDNKSEEDDSEPEQNDNKSEEDYSEPEQDDKVETQDDSEQDDTEPEQDDNKPEQDVNKSGEDDSEPEQDGKEPEEDDSEPEQDNQESSNEDKKTAHTHNWVEKTKTIYHDEVGHYEPVQVGTETVVDEVAWDEEVYEDYCICSACGYETTSDDDMAEHVIDAHDNDASWSVKSRVVDTIHHEAVTHEEPVYEDQWVIDEEAWTEEKVVGYYCTECGATK